MYRGQLNQLAQNIHHWAKEKGFYDNSRTFGEYAALYHSEISEAFEEYRNGHQEDEIYYGDDGKPEGIPIELADAIIRILDSCAFYGIDIEEAIDMKMAYNERRPYRHGGKIV